MDSSAARSRSRGRSLLLTAGLLVVLLGAVAIASTGDTPIGEGGSRRPSDRIADVLLSLGIVVMAAGAVFVVWLVLWRRNLVAQELSGPKARRRRIVSALLGLVFLFLFGLVLRFFAGDEDLRLQPPRPGQTAAPTGTGADGMESPPYDPEFTLLPVLLVVGLVTVGALAAWLAYRGRRRALGDGGAPVAEALADVLDETLDDLRAEADPRRAVIAAYARVERALAAYGLPRRPSEAPEEYLERILLELEVGRRSVSRLTALYERAKFSQHDVDEGMKEDAIAALEQVRDELRAAEAQALAEREAALREARERAAV